MFLKSSLHTRQDMRTKWQPTVEVMEMTGLTRSEFMADVLGMTAICVTTLVVLWLPAILTA